MLHRALCTGGASGRYVDVGASSPYLGSVTRHFYEAGWSGIDVEPLAEEAAELRRARPRDVVIEAALGSTRARSPSMSSVTNAACRAQTRRWARATSEPAARCGSEWSAAARWQMSSTSTAPERSRSSRSTWRAPSPKCCRETTGPAGVRGWSSWRRPIRGRTSRRTRAGSRSCWQLDTSSLPSTGSTASTRAPRSQISCRCSRRRACSTTSSRRTSIVSRATFAISRRS